MKLVASSSGDIDALTWAIFWRYGLLGLTLTIVAGLALYMVFVFCMYFYYSATVGLPQRELVSVHPIASIVALVIPVLVALAFNRLILKWILRSLHGKNIGGMTFLLATVSNDKDLENAN